MEAGVRIGPNIRLERMLSEGGMGSVWVADHLTLGIQVAVKFITRDLADDAQMLTRFQREATAAAQIKSPHVVQVFDHGVTDDGQPYIVMELLHGEDLDVRIERLGRLSLAETVLVVRHTCKALAVAHRLGIVHRDIKPANLFVVDADGEPFVKVLDFGIAKRRSEAGTISGVTNTGAMVGTPHFMSPEQVTSSRDAGASADLWALAVVAYNCLLGRRPFEGETVGALCIAINAARFLPPSLVDPALPEALDAWFERALARDPAARFTSAEKELAEAFAAAAPSSARSIRPPAGTAPTVVSEAPRKSMAPTLAQPAAARSGAPQTLGGASVKTDPGKGRSRTLIVAVLGVLAVGGITLWLATPRGITADSAAAASGTSTAASAVAPAASSGTSSVPSATASMPPPAAVASMAAAGSAPATTSAAAAIASATTAGNGPAGAAATGAATTTSLLHALPRASHSASPSPALPPPPKDRGF